MSTFAYIAIHNGLYSLAKPLCTLAIIGITVHSTIKSMEAIHCIEKYNKRQNKRNLDNNIDIHDSLY